MVERAGPEKFLADPGGLICEVATADDGPSDWREKPTCDVVDAAGRGGRPADDGGGGSAGEGERLILEPGGEDVMLLLCVGRCLVFG